MITLALPSRGRLAREVELFVQQAGLTTERAYRSLQCTDAAARVKIIFVHHKDAGMLVEQGYVDFAITAQDILAEHPSQVRVLAQLGFGQCQIVLAVPETLPVQSIADMEGQVIATCYPRFTQAWLVQHQLQCPVVPLHGSLEIMPALGIATGIVDTYQTGISARMHSLRVIATLMHSQAVLIGNIASEKHERIMKTLCLSS